MNGRPVAQPVRITLLNGPYKLGTQSARWTSGPPGSCGRPGDRAAGLVPPVSHGALTVYDCVHRSCMRPVTPGHIRKES